MGAFHGGEGEATDEFANLAALQGTATYDGPAAGQFAILREGGAAEAGASRRWSWSRASRICAGTTSA